MIFLEEFFVYLVGAAFVNRKKRQIIYWFYVLGCPLFGIYVAQCLEYVGSNLEASKMSGGWKERKTKSWVGEVWKFDLLGIWWHMEGKEAAKFSKQSFVAMSHNL